MGEWERGGKSDDWYTPACVFDALGGEVFDLDVAGDPVAPAYCVPARASYKAHGLELDWRGFVWMNPPFGGRNALTPWLEKFFQHGNGIALTPDRTSAPWFQSAWRAGDVVLFTRKLRFLRPDGTQGVAPANGTALWSAGNRGRRALVRAAERGFGILAIAGIGKDHPIDERLAQ